MRLQNISHYTQSMVIGCFKKGLMLCDKKNLTYCEVLRCYGKKMPEKECYWCFFWAKFWPKNCDQNKIVFDSERSWAVKPSPCPVFRDFCSNFLFHSKAFNLYSKVLLACIKQVWTYLKIWLFQCSIWILKWCKHC